MWCVTNSPRRSSDTGRSRQIGIVLDVHTGEVLAMSSLPDYDPNDPAEALEKDRMNRATAGVFEMGSVFKAFNTAMALDSGLVSMDDTFDATQAAAKVRSRTINDFHAKRRVLTVPEVFIYSSNIGSARMARKVGVDGQRAFFDKVGLTHRLSFRIAGNGVAAFAAEMGRTDLDDHRLRPRNLGVADAYGGDRGGAR